MTSLLFTTASYDYLGVAMCASGAFERGVVERRAFPDGERYQRLTTDPADRDVVLIGGTIGESDTLELYDLASTLVTCGAYRLTLVIPFFGYSTMERAVRAGEIVTAKTRARLLSSIPQASRGNQVFLVDLHVAAIAHYFEGQIRPVHVYAKQVIVDACRRLAGRRGVAARAEPERSDAGATPAPAEYNNDFVLACTDAGRAKWVESLANDLGVAAAFVYKRRLDGAHTEVTGVSAQVAGKKVVIYDDMIRTGGSLINAARAYQEAGALSIDAVATHGVFPDDSLARIRGTGLFGKIVTTDTHPRAVSLAGDFLEVPSIATVLVEHLRSNR